MTLLQDLIKTIFSKEHQIIGGITMVGAIITYLFLAKVRTHSHCITVSSKDDI